ncbi:hypothetical protein ABEB36_011396 [Hypothenemus hampei]|uniref:Rho-GAP domain-containing protein n=1 Tax=Hypothenemus hampei TaxID=57062 RepID=A0ABD1EF99_HYPHA
MDFDNPDAMEDFPGLYRTEKRKGNDNEYNDDTEKASKKEMIIGKRKDKKDKDKGYAALEGESSDEASPCKAKKSKAFIFTKSKDKEHVKDKGEGSSAKNWPKKKVKLGFGKTTNAETRNIADALPIFGVDLKKACQRGKCHDGILIPLPVRECIDFIEETGLNYEYVYKTSGHRSKVAQIKKLYNSRQNVDLSMYEIPVVTSLLKGFLRDLPEPVFTVELLIRFEEAGAILNYHHREKYLRSLINSLPEENRTLLSFLIIHFHNVIQRDQVNKMNKQNLAQALNHSLHISSRLLKALLTHRIDLFPEEKITKYVPPLDASSSYPTDMVLIKEELSKLESALNLIHWEIQQGFCPSWRQDQLWEVQRLQTDLKRKLKKELSQVVGDHESEEETKLKRTEASLQQEKDEERFYSEPEKKGTSSATVSENYSDEECVEPNYQSPFVENTKTTTTLESSHSPDTKNGDLEEEFQKLSCRPHSQQIRTFQIKNKIMTNLIMNLEKSIANEYNEIEQYKTKLDKMVACKKKYRTKVPHNFENVRDLLFSENRMLEIKKLELVRKIVEVQEQCTDLKSKIILFSE